MLHLDEPLERQTRLDRYIRTLGITDLIVIILDLLHESERLQVFDDLFAAIETVHAVVLAYVRLEFRLDRVHIQVRVRREDINCLEVVFLSQRIVVHVVCGRHFEATGTETDLDVTILNDRNHTTHTRHDDVLTFEPLILFLLGVDANSNIAKNRLRTRGCHNRVLTRFLCYLITEIVELVMLVVVDDLLVGEGRLTLRVPVNHTQTAVDETFVIEVTEHLDDSFGTGFVHGESGAVPIAGTAEFAELFEDDSSVLVGPVPGMFQKLLTRQVRLIDTLLFEALDDLGFGRNRGMVRTRHPAGVLAFQACTTYQNILNRLIEYVTHVQHTRYVGRRNNDGKRFPAIRLRMKEIIVQPVLVPAGFNVSRIVL